MQLTAEPRTKSWFRPFYGVCSVHSFIARPVCFAMVPCRLDPKLHSQPTMGGESECWEAKQTAVRISRSLRCLCAEGEVGGCALQGHDERRAARARHAPPVHHGGDHQLTRRGVQRHDRGATRSGFAWCDMRWCALSL